MYFEKFVNINFKRKKTYYLVIFLLLQQNIYFGPTKESLFHKRVSVSLYSVFINLLFQTVLWILASFCVTSQLGNVYQEY